MTPFEAPYAPGATRGTLVMNAMSGILPVRLIRRENGQLLAQRLVTPVPGDGDPCWVDYDEATPMLTRAWRTTLAAADWRRTLAMADDDVDFFARLGRVREILAEANKRPRAAMVPAARAYYREVGR